jgi:hypothetical protein
VKHVGSQHDIIDNTHKTAQDSLIRHLSALGAEIEKGKARVDARQNVHSLVFPFPLLTAKYLLCQFFQGVKAFGGLVRNSESKLVLVLGPHVKRPFVSEHLFYNSFHEERNTKAAGIDILGFVDRCGVREQSKILTVDHVGERVHCVNFTAALRHQIRELNIFQT